MPETFAIIPSHNSFKILLLFPPNLVIIVIFFLFSTCNEWWWQIPLKSLPPSGSLCHFPSCGGSVIIVPKVLVNQRPRTTNQLHYNYPECPSWNCQPFFVMHVQQNENLVVPHPSFHIRTLAIILKLFSIPRRLLFLKLFQHNYCNPIHGSKLLPTHYTHSKWSHKIIATSATATVIIPLTINIYSMPVCMGLAQDCMLTRNIQQ